MGLSMRMMYAYGLHFWGSLSTQEVSGSVAGALGASSDVLREPNDEDDRQGNLNDGNHVFCAKIRI